MKANSKEYTFVFSRNLTHSLGKSAFRNHAGLGSLQPKDYLQVFSLSEEDGKQKVIHTQEVPEYRAEYYINTSDTVDGKVFVIDDGMYATMLMNYEY